VAARVHARDHGHLGDRRQHGARYTAPSVAPVDPDGTGVARVADARARRELELPVRRDPADQRRAAPQLLAVPGGALTRPAPLMPDGTCNRAGAAGPRSRRDVKLYERRLATPAMAVTAATRIATATAPTTRTSTQSPMLSTVNFEKPTWRMRLSTAAVSAPA